MSACSSDDDGDDNPGSSSSEEMDDSETEGTGLGPGPIGVDSPVGGSPDFGGETAERIREATVGYLGEFGISCGEVQLGASRVETNTCLAQAYSTNVGAYALYQTLGEDGAEELEGIVTAGGNEGTLGQFLVDPEGTDEGEIFFAECIDFSHSLSGSVEDGIPFDCPARELFGPLE